MATYTELNNAQVNVLFKSLNRKGFTSVGKGAHLEQPRISSSRAQNILMEGIPDIAPTVTTTSDVIIDLKNDHSVPDASYEFVSDQAKGGIGEKFIFNGEPLEYIHNAILQPVPNACYSKVSYDSTETREGYAYASETRETQFDNSGANFRLLDKSGNNILKNCLLSGDGSGYGFDMFFNPGVTVTSEGSLHVTNENRLEILDKTTGPKFDFYYTKKVEGDWKGRKIQFPYQFLIDPDSGIISFLEYPSIHINKDFPPIVSFYRYSGTIGVNPSSSSETLATNTSVVPSIIAQCFISVSEVSSIIREIRRTNIRKRMDAIFACNIEVIRFIGIKATEAVTLSKLTSDPILDSLFNLSKNLRIETFDDPNVSISDFSLSYARVQTYDEFTVPKPTSFTPGFSPDATVYELDVSSQEYTEIAFGDTRTFSEEAPYVIRYVITDAFSSLTLNYDLRIDIVERLLITGFDDANVVMIGASNAAQVALSYSGGFERYRHFHIPEPDVNRSDVDIEVIFYDNTTQTNRDVTEAELAGSDLFRFDNVGVNTIKYRLRDTKTDDTVEYILHIETFDRSPPTLVELLPLSISKGGVFSRSYTVEFPEPFYQPDGHVEHELIHNAGDIGQDETFIVPVANWRFPSQTSYIVEVNGSVREKESGTYGEINTDILGLHEIHYAASDDQDPPNKIVYKLNINVIDTIFPTIVPTIVPDIISVHGQELSTPILSVSGVSGTATFAEVTIEYGSTFIVPNVTMTDGKGSEKKDIDPSSYIMYKVDADGNKTVLKTTYAGDGFTLSLETETHALEIVGSDSVHTSNYVIPLRVVPTFYPAIQEFSLTSTAYRLSLFYFINHTNLPNTTRVYIYDEDANEMKGIVEEHKSPENSNAWQIIEANGARDFFYTGSDRIRIVFEITKESITSAFALDNINLIQKASSDGVTDATLQTISYQRHDANWQIQDFSKNAFDLGELKDLSEQPYWNATAVGAPDPSVMSLLKNSFSGFFDYETIYYQGNSEIGNKAYIATETITLNSSSDTITNALLGGSKSGVQQSYDITISSEPEIRDDDGARIYTLTHDLSDLGQLDTITAPTPIWNEPEYPDITTARPTDRIENEHPGSPSSIKTIKTDVVGTHAIKYIGTDGRDPIFSAEYVLNITVVDKTPPRILYMSAGSYFALYFLNRNIPDLSSTDKIGTATFDTQFIEKGSYFRLIKANFVDDTLETVEGGSTPDGDPYTMIPPSSVTTTVDGITSIPDSTVIDTSTPRTTQIQYRGTDSHGNVSTYTMPLTILDIFVPSLMVYHSGSGVKIPAWIIADGHTDKHPRYIQSVGHTYAYYEIIEPLKDIAPVPYWTLNREGTHSFTIKDPVWSHVIPAQQTDPGYDASNIPNLALEGEFMIMYSAEYWVPELRKWRTAEYRLSFVVVREIVTFPTIVSTGSITVNDKILTVPTLSLKRPNQVGTATFAEVIIENGSWFIVPTVTMSHPSTLNPIAPSYTLLPSTPLTAGQSLMLSVETYNLEIKGSSAAGITSKYVIPLTILEIFVPSLTVYPKIGSMIPSSGTSWIENIGHTDSSPRYMQTLNYNYASDNTIQPLNSIAPTPSWSLNRGGSASFTIIDPVWYVKTTAIFLTPVDPSQALRGDFRIVYSAEYYVPELQKTNRAEYRLRFVVDQDAADD